MRKLTLVRYIRLRRIQRNRNKRVKRDWQQFWSSLELKKFVDDQHNKYNSQ